MPTQWQAKATGGANSVVARRVRNAPLWVVRFAISMHHNGLFAPQEPEYRRNEPSHRHAGGRSGCDSPLAPRRWRAAPLAKTRWSRMWRCRGVARATKWLLGAMAMAMLNEMEVAMEIEIAIAIEIALAH